MKNTLKIALVAALVSMGCHSKESLNREQQNYQVVQEGAATGTTTSVGVGGDAAQTPPITGTNADTTTAFTIAANGVPQQAGTSTGGLMPPPNVGAGGAPAMPNYPIPPGLARTMGGGSSSPSSSSGSSTAARRTTQSEPARRSDSQSSQSMTSAGETASTHTAAPAPSNTSTSAPAETTASTPPPATDSAAPRKSDQHNAAPAPAPAEDPAPAEEPSTEAPPATQTGTFGPL